MKALMRYIFCLALTMCCLGSLQASSLGGCITNKQLNERQGIDQVISDEQGVFLLVDGFWVGSQGVQVMPDGIFVLENGEWIPLPEVLGNEEFNVWRCRVCIVL